MNLPAPQIVAAVLFLIGITISVTLLIKSARGRARVSGIVGAVLMFLGIVIGFTYRWLLEPFVGADSDSTPLLSLAAPMVVSSVLTGAGVVLLTCALMVASGPRPRWPVR